MLMGGSDPAWQPPEQSKIMLGSYATHWIADRRLEPQTANCMQCSCGCTSCPGSAGSYCPPQLLHHVAGLQSLD
jgi:hypothetical protein